MCGRYALKTDYKALAKRFNAEPPQSVTDASRYNISPTQAVPVIRNTNPHQIELVHWGIVPVWDKTGKKTIINARKDSLDKPTFKKSFYERRCLVLADSFYEWLTVPGQRVKRPFRFLLKSEQPFAFAGIWKGQEDEEGNETHCAIITTDPNGTVAKVHNRMPAILMPGAEAEWLNLDTTPEQALELIQPYPDNEMQSYEVSTLINSPANNTPDVFKPPNSQ
jgi:putative SOS response-associated peptidase YedK